MAGPPKLVPSRARSSSTTDRDERRGAGPAAAATGRRDHHHGQPGQHRRARVERPFDTRCTHPVERRERRGRTSTPRVGCEPSACTARCSGVGSVVGVAERRPRSRCGDCRWPTAGGHDGAVTYCIAMRLDEGLAVPVRHPHQRRDRQHQHLPQAARLPPGRGPDLRAAVRRQPGHDPAGPRPHRPGPRRRPSRAAWPRSPACSRPPSTSVRLSTEVAAEHREALGRVGADGTATLHPRRSDRRRGPRHPARVPGGQLHPGVGRPALPPDRRDQVREAHARPRRLRRSRPGPGGEDGRRRRCSAPPAPTSRWGRPTTSGSTGTARSRSRRADATPSRRRSTPSPTSWLSHLVDGAHASRDPVDELRREAAGPAPPADGASGAGSSAQH